MVSDKLVIRVSLSINQSEQENRFHQGDGNQSQTPCHDGKQENISVAGP
jgi:hypothetical protein